MPCRRHASSFRLGLSIIPSPGIEPGLRPYQSRVLPSHPKGILSQSHRFSTAQFTSALYGSRTHQSLLDRQVASPAASQGVLQSVRRESHPSWSTLAEWCLCCSATDTFSRDGRSRTFSAGFGGPLLSQEHVPVSRAAPAGLEPAPFPLTAGRTTVVLQGNTQVRMAGFEPTLSGPPVQRISQALPHPDGDRTSRRSCFSSPHQFGRRGACRSRTYSFGFKPNLTSL